MIADFIEFGLAVVLVSLVLFRSYLERGFHFVADRPWLAMTVAAILPVGLRLALLGHHPVPQPVIYDEFGHLLVADTLLHFRLANPPHPLSQFFETFFVLQQPTYSSIYSTGQGLALATGRAIFGLAWAGVLLATAAFSALTYWMLSGWVRSAWALCGALLVVCLFGPLCLWSNGYWGGSLAATSGCMVFGALPRLRERVTWFPALMLGAGMGLHALVRQFESIFLVAAILLFLALHRQILRPTLFLALIPIALAGGLTIAQNKAVTGDWLTVPERLGQYQYGVPATLSIEPNAVPHRALTPQQQAGYEVQVSFHGPHTDTVRTFLERLRYRIRFVRFFFLPPLYLAIGACFFAWRDWRLLYAAAVLFLFALGVNLFPAFQFHYVAGVVCLMLLLAVIGLQRFHRDIAFVMLALCAIHFGFWYAMHITDSRVREFETWNVINHDSPTPRRIIETQLDRAPGRQVVFVRYWPNHIFQNEWVYNEADIDASHTVWARDLGEPENQKLLRYYPGRVFWTLEPDAEPPKLSRYEPPLPPALPPAAAPAPVKPVPEAPTLRFENIPPAK